MSSPSYRRLRHRAVLRQYHAVVDTALWIAAGGAALLYAALVPFSSVVRLGLAGLGLPAIFIGVWVSIAYCERLARIKRAGHSPSAWTGLGSGKA